MMALDDVTEGAVTAALNQFDLLGRDQFLEATGFGRAKSYFLERDGKLYDSKAIVGYAHGVSGDRPWRAGDFSGGEKTVADRLRTLGFTVRFLRNPTWTWDEIVLACALVEAQGWRTVAQERAEVVELSRILQSKAIHPLEGRASDFRNPAGVERKTGDLVSCLPGHRRTNGTVWTSRWSTRSAVDLRRCAKRPGRSRLRCESGATVRTPSQTRTYLTASPRKGVHSSARTSAASAAHR